MRFTSYLSDLRLGHKIIASLVAVLVLLLGVVVFVFASISDLRNRHQLLYDRDMESMKDFINLRNNINMMQSDILLMLLVDSSTVRDARKADIKEATDRSFKMFPPLKERFENDPKTLAQITKLEAAMHEYVKERDEELIPLIVQRAIEDAKTLLFGIQAENLQNINDLAKELGEQSLKAALDQVKASGSTADNARSAALFSCFIAVVVSVGACLYLVRSLNSATEQLHKAVNVLGDGVDQILASVSESAAGTTETATAVNETTATVEQLKQTSQLSSERAKGVFESSQRSEEISASGRKATEETAEGMKRIRKEMDQIAQSMARLNEKARDIVEIIATVDDLAKQSNLLAVNAAIEAAKAGEHGKGFAVVAQEVKNMAAQSKQATAQVRAILDEIQIAAASAAQATELGSQAVDSAVKQSSYASDSIMQLASSVSESAIAAAQIATASQQQVAGADQVVTAILGIKEAAQHNVTAIGRVEEAANSLNSLGNILREIVKRY